MRISPEDITIAVTVFSRREFVFNAIRSALNQTMPVKVIVVEDCGPDPGMRAFILNEFGPRIEYFRNPVNRGLFDNWNACLEYCRTPWLSILHDDDSLRPNFVEAMIQLAQAAPGKALYFGRQTLLRHNLEMRPPPETHWPNAWRDIALAELAANCFLSFPGHLLSVETALAIGGFPKNSFLTGDWHMWLKLTSIRGGAQAITDVAINREHEGHDRGSTRVERNGWKWVLDNVQRKRNVALLRREKGIVLPFRRAEALNLSPIPLRLLLRHAHGFRERLLKYNWWLFVHSKPPNAAYATVQHLARLLGPQSLRWGSILARRCDFRSQARIIPFLFALPFFIVAPF